MENDILIPKNWDKFVHLAVEVHKVKNTDYENAFMDMLLDKTLDGRSIWAWEVKKKLDRLRRWIKRGQLLVKGEGVLDSVIDLSNYTVQYDISGHNKPYSYLKASMFRARYEFLGPDYILRYLTNPHYEGVKLLDCGDVTDAQVILLIKQYMGLNR